MHSNPNQPSSTIYGRTANSALLPLLHCRCAYVLLTCVRGVFLLCVISSRRGRISGITPTHPNFRYLKRTEPLYLFFFFLDLLPVLAPSPHRRLRQTWLTGASPIWLLAGGGKFGQLMHTPLSLLFCTGWTDAGLETDASTRRL